LPTKLVELFYTSNREESNLIKLVYEFDDSEMTLFTEGAIENLFTAIQTLENEENTYEENEELCVVRYGFRQIEIMRLFYAMRNYHLTHNLANVHFSKSYSALHLLCDMSEDRDDCLSCGYSSTEPEFFYYSNSDYPNVPVCFNCFYNKSSNAKPSEAESSEAKPSGAESSEAKPSGAEPSEAKPSEAGPSGAEPSEAKPSEAKPSEAGPSEAKPSEKYNNEYINISNINEPSSRIPLYINRIN
jgi:hypothetical protein